MFLKGTRLSTARLGFRRVPLLLGLIALVAWSGPVQAITIPQGFNLTHSWQGTGSGGTGTAIRVYRKNYAAPGQPDFVTVVDLRYATLQSTTGTVHGSGNCRTVSQRSLCCAAGSHWSVASGTAGLRVLISGTFFSHLDDPTGIAFGLRQNGTTISYGYGVNSNDMDCSAASEYPGNTYTFRFNNATDQAAAGSYSFSQFSDVNFPNVIGGLQPTCCKNPAAFIPRTMVGVRDDNGDGTVETVFFYSSAYARLSDADGALRAFGATSTTQLDGGTTAGFVVDGTRLVTPGRNMPHAIAMYAQ